MSEKKLLTRMLILCGMAFLIFVALITRLVWLQFVRGADDQIGTVSNTVRLYEEVVSRGQILDRNGNPLVTNSLGYSLQLDYFNWDRQIQNDVILEVCDILTEAGLEPIKALPMTEQLPYTYTYSSLESGDGLRLARFLEQNEDWPQNPTPQQLFSLLCEHFDVADQLTVEQKRVIIDLRYYLELQQFSAYNTPITIAEDVDNVTIAQIEERSLRLPGINTQVEDVREYNTLYAAHLLGRVAAISASEYEQLKDEGYLMTDSIGKSGVESSLEHYLRGIDGQIAIELDGLTGEVVSEYTVVQSDPGDTVVLTIDIALQAAAEQALERTLNQIREDGANRSDGRGADAEGGAAVVVDVNTGQVLALASWPTYNIELYAQQLSENLQDPLAPYYNRAVSAAYPPGSTFKMATAVAALETGTIDVDTEILDRGYFTEYDDYQPRCWIYTDRGITHGYTDVRDAIQYSCNYYFYQVAYDMGIDPIVEYASALGLGRETGIELPENTGILAGPESSADLGRLWFDGQALAAAIGQSDNQFTPVQLAGYVAALVNGGNNYRLTLLKEVIDYTGDNIVATGYPEITSSIDINDEYIEAIKEGMRGVVTEDGTASSVFRNYPIEVGGKTGSAQSNEGRSAHGVFVAFAPYDQPEIAVCVVGDYAGSGGNVAPVAIAIFDEYFGLTTTDPYADLGDITIDDVVENEQ